MTANVPVSVRGANAPNSFVIPNSITSSDSSTPSTINRSPIFISTAYTKSIIPCFNRAMKCNSESKRVIFVAVFTLTYLALRSLSAWMNVMNREYIHLLSAGSNVFTRSPRFSFHISIKPLSSVSTRLLFAKHAKRHFWGIINCYMFKFYKRILNTINWCRCCCCCCCCSCGCSVCGCSCAFRYVCRCCFHCECIGNNNSYHSINCSYHRNNSHNNYANEPSGSRCLF